MIWGSRSAVAVAIKNITNPASLYMCLSFLHSLATLGRVAGPQLCRTQCHWLLEERGSDFHKDNSLIDCPVQRRQPWNHIHINNKNKLSRCVCMCVCIPTYICNRYSKRKRDKKKKRLSTWEWEWNMGGVWGRIPVGVEENEAEISDVIWFQLKTN